MSVKSKTIQRKDTKKRFNAAHLATGHQTRSSQDQKKEKQNDSTQRRKVAKTKSKKRFNAEPQRNRGFQSL
jgi:hypothetical protein